MNTPTNYDNVIDSRDIITAIESLESDIQDLTDEMDELDANGDGATGHGDGSTRYSELRDERTDLEAELAPLKAFADEASEVSDWEYGETFIRDDYFQDYAEELARDCAPSKEIADLLDGSHDLGWPFTSMTIDWEQAARELRYDYTGYDFDGVTYWARAW